MSSVPSLTINQVFLRWKANRMELHTVLSSSMGQWGMRNSATFLLSAFKTVEAVCGVCSCWPEMLHAESIRVCVCELTSFL